MLTLIKEFGVFFPSGTTRLGAKGRNQLPLLTSRVHWQTTNDRYLPWKNPGILQNLHNTPDTFVDAILHNQVLR